MAYPRGVPKKNLNPPNFRCSSPPLYKRLFLSPAIPRFRSEIPTPATPSDPEAGAQPLFVERPTIAAVRHESRVVSSQYALHFFSVLMRNLMVW